MALDIVEIALDSMTDAFGFEKLAAEVMRDEGYHDIKPLGGGYDLGQDAVQDKFYHREGRVRIVLQFTLEDYIAGKLRDTVEKLEQNAIDFSELVIVTPSKLSSSRQHDLTRMARTEYDITLHIYERKTLVNRLSDFTNGIFHRHFPDIDRQIKAVRANKPAFGDTDGELETAMLKVSIAFVFGKGAEPVRKSIFDHLVMATSVGKDSPGITSSDISKSIAGQLGCEPFPESQIAASLRRLEARDVVTPRDGHYTLTDKAVNAIESATIEANTLTASSISDIVEEICEVSRRRVSRQERNRLQRNARDVLAEMFRLMGIELANQFLEDSIPSPLYLEATDHLLDLAKRQVDDTLGELLVLALADAIQDPTTEQSQMLASWARAYLGAAVMNLDPSLRAFQATRLGKKVFILDTDFVLRCLVDELPDSAARLALVQRLADLGCRVIVPEAVVSECATHAELSPRTLKYFSGSLYGLTPAFVERKVYNVFVQGFYYALRDKKIPSTWPFSDYLANYYDPAAPVRFAQDVIAARLPSAVEIRDPTTILPNGLPADLVDQVAAELLELLERTPKSEYRTEHENQQLAYTDASLYVTALQVNTEIVVCANLKGTHPAEL
jgi:hypothetical protein